MKKLFFLFPVLIMTACHTKVDYRDASAPIDARVESLLSQMSLEQKVGQMNQLTGIEHIKANSQTMTEDDLFRNTANAYYPGFTPEDIEQMTRQGLVGSFLHVLTYEEADYLQHLAMEATPAIPLLIGIDAIHGNAKCRNNTVYPTHIGLACSFDTAMAYTIAAQTAKEMRAMSMHWTFDPNVEVARDPRWGRVGETFGEDPFLVTQMGVQTVKGLEQNGVLSCVKHLIGGSEPINGTNGSPADLSERTLREIFFPPFEACVKAGASTFMTAHNELNGVPCHANEWLIQDILRKEWGFKGWIVSDWMDIEHLCDLHHIAADNKDAFRQAIEAGLDMHMHGVSWQKAVCDLVREGVISEKRLDESVRMILRSKFELGLFEQPYVTKQYRDSVCFAPEHQATALAAAEQSIVLLKNDGILPLRQGAYKRVLVTGINANDDNIMGDWSEPQPMEQVWTVLRGLREQDPTAVFDFVDQGWDPRNMDAKQVDKAAAAAKQADLNIVCVGEYMMRWRWLERTSGEDTDRSDIDLVGLQNELVARVAASGKPTIVIVISGRPLGLEQVNKHANALVYAWEPGQFGGKAIAEIVYGEVNPSAKLAVSLPYSVGQVQMIYNHKPSQYFHPYVCDKPSDPLYAFGQGLSYTTFAYSDLSDLSDMSDSSDAVTVSVAVTNTGDRAGTEIVQLYVRDDIGSVTRPVKALRGFKRVTLQAGETQTVTFDLTDEDFAMYDRRLRKVVEPGTFTIYVGASSRDEDLLSTTFTIQ